MELKKIYKYKSWLFYLVIFTLPMYTKINNSLLVVFVVLSLIQMFINPKNITFKTSFLNGWPVLGFFMLSVLASFRTTDLQSFKFLENHWSLLFVPVVMLSDKDFYNQRRRGAFLSLLWGSFLTLLICESTIWSRLLFHLVGYM